MRELELFGTQLQIQGSPLTLMFYQKEFGTDLVQDWFDEKSLTKCMNSITLLQVAWAMNKTADLSVPTFNQWLCQFEDFSLAGIFDEGSWARRVDEAVAAELFRERKTKKSTK